MYLIHLWFLIELCALQFLKKNFFEYISHSPAGKPVHTMTHPFHLYNIPLLPHLFFLLYFHFALTNACLVFLKCTFVVEIGLSPSPAGSSSRNFEGLSAFSPTEHTCHGFASFTPLSLQATDSLCRGCPSV